VTAPIAALLGVLADLCGDVPADGARDRDAAAAYASVGDDARASGDVRVAAVAYRKALASDPDQAGARAALDAMCRADRTGALAGDDGAHLNAAIARFRAGELDDAAARLRPIAAGGGASSATAHLFLGLIALQRHDGKAAAIELDRAARDPQYAAIAAPLSRLARRDGLVVVQLMLQPEIDSNAALLPDTPPAGSTAGPPQTDEDLLTVGSLTARPWPWLSLRDTILWRAQRTLSELDFVAQDAQVEATFDRGGDHAALRYDFDSDLLAGDPYLLAHRVTAGYRHELGRATLSASYAIRRRAYQGASEAAFTGWVHAADAGALIRAADHLDVDARVLASREGTADPTYAAWIAGGQVAARWRPSAGLRVNASATGWYARYDGAEPDGEMRRDTHVEAGLDGEYDLGDHVIAMAGVAATRNDSTVEDFRYVKLVARLGVAVLFGVP